MVTLFRRLEATLAGIPFEVVFVDDNSPDGTWQVLRALSRDDARVRCIRRIGRRGLSGACIEGILASSAPYAAVIDADLQHDETQLPKMLAPAARRPVRSRRRQPLHRGRQRRKFQPSAGWREPACDRSCQTRAPRRGRRSHERLLHDPPRSFRSNSRRNCRRKASRSCSMWLRPRAASFASRKFPTHSARACTAKASSIPWSRWTSSASCWRS